MMPSSLKCHFFASIAVALAFLFILNPGLIFLASFLLLRVLSTSLPEELGWVPLREVLGVILSLTSDIAHWIHLS